MDRPLPNTYWVIPGRMLAGEYPLGADDDDARRRLALLCEAGVDYFVDLTEEGELPGYRHLLPAHSQHVRSAIADTWVPKSAAQMQHILLGHSRRARAGTLCLRALPRRYRPHRHGGGLLSRGGRRQRQSRTQATEPSVARERARQDLRPRCRRPWPKQTISGAGRSSKNQSASTRPSVNRHPAVIPGQECIRAGRAIGEKPGGRDGADAHAAPAAVARDVGIAIVERQAGEWRLRR